MSGVLMVFVEVLKPEISPAVRCFSSTLPLLHPQLLKRKTLI
jgi:hypothetical protein